jgi:transcription elongation factor SPT6
LGCNHVYLYSPAVFSIEHHSFFYRALQEAQEIFGGDFDFAEFDTEAYEDAEEEEDADEESWDRPKKQTKKRVGRRSIFEIYEPSELESSHMTDQDNEIRSTDMPERFQVCILL